MPIRVVCPACGKQLNAPDRLAGQRAACPGCRGVVQIPAAEAPETEDSEYKLSDAQPAPRQAPAHASPSPAGSRASVPRVRMPAPSHAVAATRGRSEAPAIATATPARRTGVRRFLYLLLGLALVPLAWSLDNDPDELKTRLQRTIEANPSAMPEEPTEGFGLDELCARLPGDRFEGAHLARSTWMHWVYALLSAAAFLAFAILCFEKGNATAPLLLGVGAATATAGIIFLLGVQWVAQFTQGFIIHGRSFLVIIFYILKFIGFSYNAALNPENGFLLSFFGFTFGVGLCEELTKALPVILRVRADDAVDWRAACAWGLASGVGFGVAEGIMYSSRYYNGIHTAEIYVIRFVSCVALHAIWSAATAILIWNQRHQFSENSNWGDLVAALAVAMGVPMMLHGLYDTMLKKDMGLAALAVALVSFAWLAGLTEWSRWREGEVSAGLAA